MINALEMYEKLSTTLDPDVARYLTSIIKEIPDNINLQITRGDFLDLKGVVAELAQAQK